MRNTMKKILYESIMKKLPKDFTEKDVIEKIIPLEEMMSQKLQGSKYINRGQALSSHILDSDNEEFRLKILKGNLSPNELVTMDTNDMVSTEEKKERKRIEENLFEAKRSDWNKRNSTVKEGVYTCFKCHGKRVTTQEIQMRSADEPMTLFITCFDCGNVWKMG